MAGKKSNKSVKRIPVCQAIPPDPCPTLPVERGPKGKGVGAWVPNEKHRLLFEYLEASRYGRRKWPSRVFIDPFAGPGRIQVVGESFTRPGGAVVAYLASTRDAPFTKLLVGDLDADRSDACEKRLLAVGAPATGYQGSATDTVKPMVGDVPGGSLSMAYIDPYSLEQLSFSILQELAELPKVDLAINFSTMDLQRNVELEFDTRRARFDEAAPGWRQHPSIRSASRSNVKLQFFRYWFELVLGLGFKHSRAMPIIHNTRGHGIYRMCFFSRHAFPQRIWRDVALGPTRSLDLFEDEPK
ncbi:MAG: hypothetical protein C5B58_07175 [Acidobacteria bacterium]|nr:MAG: hypothetical protein C5B58_07175 [Acidobacteriota bacterium]